MAGWSIPLFRLTSMMMTRPFFLMIAACVATAYGAPRTPGIENFEFNSNGSFTLDGLAFEVVHFTPDWKRSSQSQTKPGHGFPKSGGGSWQSAVVMPAKNATLPFEVSTELKNREAGELGVSYEVKHPEGVATQEVSLQITLPLTVARGRSFELDGQTHEFPEEFGETFLMRGGKVARHSLTLPSESGTLTLSGVFGVLIQDQRTWDGDAYTVRLRFPDSKDNFTTCSLKADIRQTPYKIHPIDLRKVVNRGFADEVDGDGAGGWTDQGPDNDLSVMRPGRLLAAGVGFDIIDPAANDAKAAIVLGRAGSSKNPVEVDIPIDSEEVWKNLYLLHAAAWLPANGQPVGRVRVTYADGSESVQDIIAGREIGNWWSPSDMERGVVGWEAENKSSPVGLYVSPIPLESKSVSRIRLESDGSSLWMLAGMSASPEDIRLIQAGSHPLTIVAGRRWVAFEHRLDIHPGGVFDASRFKDAPAGKYGPIIITKEGGLAFADRPDVRVRFWGVNICSTANYLTPEEGVTLADRMLASGYNTVRFHHYDKGLVNTDDPEHSLNPEALDKLDRLFHLMKERGLYISIDLFSLREFSDEVAKAMGMDVSAGNYRNQFKALIPISEEVFQNWARFSKALLTHRNPYTGLTWAEDPALIFICPVNEDNLNAWIDASPQIRERYGRAFEQWWEEPTNRKFNGDDKERGYNHYLHDVQIRNDARMHAFLRDLGVKALLSGANFRGTQGLTYLRQEYDYVDNHQYWDHPKFPGERFRLPFAFHQRCGVRSAIPTPGGIMASRIWNKPYVVSEFHFVRPNQYRAEGAVIMPAYASLQDWDALYNFDYSSSASTVLSGGVDGAFALSDDPLALLSDRIGALLFLRRDIEAGRHRIGYAVTPERAFTTPDVSFPGDFVRLGLLTQIGSSTLPVAEQAGRYHLNALVTANGTEQTGVPVFSPSPELRAQLIAAGVLPSRLAQSAARYLSDTGQIELDTEEGTLKVVTDLSESFVLSEKSELSGKFASVRNGETFCSVTVISVDDKPLPGSGRLLVVHLTDALASGTQFGDQKKTLLVGRGKAPHLVLAGEAVLTLDLSADKEWSAWVVDASGARVRPAALERKGEKWELPLSTVTKEGTQLAYEVVAK